MEAPCLGVGSGWRIWEGLQKNRTLWGQLNWSEGRKGQRMESRMTTCSAHFTEGTVEPPAELGTSTGERGWEVDSGAC